MIRSPVIEVENTSIPPGGEARVSVSVSNITEAKMYPPAGEWTIEYENISPQPRITMKSMPPVWVWDSSQPEVTIEASLYTPDEVSPGDYYYSVAVRNRECDTEDWTHESGVITVIESPTY